MKFILTVFFVAFIVFTLSISTIFYNKNKLIEAELRTQLVDLNTTNQNLTKKLGLLQTEQSLVEQPLDSLLSISQLDLMEDLLVTYPHLSDQQNHIIIDTIFETSEDGQDIECKAIQMKHEGKNYTFNFMNLFQFMYFISNEELRQGLAMRYQRRANRIPYEVTFKLSPEEITRGMCKRRIELTVDELAMAIARNEAWKLMPHVQKQILEGAKPQELFKGRS